MIDVNVKGVLYGIAAALPVFRRQSFGHFINTLSTAGLTIVPTMAVYAGSKNRAGDLRGAPSGGRPKPAGHDGISRLWRHGACILDDRPGSAGKDAIGNGHNGHSTARYRRSDRLRDRIARQC